MMVKEVTVTLTDKDRTYTGQAIITSFPITANYNDAFMYSLIFFRNRSFRNRRYNDRKNCND